MAIQRQAENPGESLVLDKPFQYSIKPSKKNRPVGEAVAPAKPAHSVESVRRDLTYTFIVFAGIILVIAALYIKMR
jgi:hypothetical protein